MARRFPRLIPVMFRLRFPKSAGYILGDLIEEYGKGNYSRGRLWREAVSALLPTSHPQQRLYYPRKHEMNLLTSFWNDLHYATRTLRQNPSFTVVAVLALALGIGVNTGIFTVLDGVALRPLPARDSGDLVSVYQTFVKAPSRNVHGAASFFSTLEYETYRDNNHVFSGLVAYGPVLEVTFGGERPRHVIGQFASCNYFEVLKEQPILGRAFAASDCAVPGESAVLVLSNDFWRDAFASDPAIAGKKIVVNRRPFTVIGVAPPGFQGTEPLVAAFWTPLTMQPVLQSEFQALTSNTSWLVLLGRRKPDVSLKKIRADLAVIAGQIDLLSPGRKTELIVGTATSLGMPEARKIVVAVGAIVLVAVGMVLLIACANVANLLLARAAGRTREIAIRLSMGASRSRLIRQLLTESLLLALVGGILGSLAAVWSFQAIVGFILSHLPPGVPPLMFHVGPDLRVLGYSLALTLATGIVFGLLPALQASRPDLNTALKAGIARTGSRFGTDGFLRQALVGGQVAVSMVLLIAAGLLLRGLYLAQTIDPGFRMKNVTVASFDLRGQGYTADRAALFHRQMMERLVSARGVDSVAQVDMVPLSDSHRGSAMWLPGDTRTHNAEINYVSPGFFPLVGIPIVRGRNLTDAEYRTGAPVAIVTESTARRFWPGLDPLGKTLKLDESGPQISVIGVARDTQVSHLGQSGETYVYLPAGPPEQRRARLLVRSAGDIAGLSTFIRGAVSALDTELPVEITRLEDNLEFWRTPSRIVATLAGCLGALALILASVGVYGVVSYGVSRRTKEIGIRMSLGAEGRDVAAYVLRRAMLPVVAGAILGVGAGAAVSRVLRSMLFGLSAHDPAVFVLVPLCLLLAALAASYVPARRAVRVDPAIALRYE